MARQEYKVQANNFTGGLITEASPLSFPENSCLDILNMDINIDGSVERRKGLIQEPNHVEVSSVWLPTAYDVAVTSYVWRNAGGISGNNYVVVQDGDVLKFFEEKDSVSDGYVPTMDIDVSSLSTGLSENTLVSMTDVRGVLIVSAKRTRPFYVTWVNATTLDITEIDFSVRDLDGIDDGLEINERPNDLTGDHLYNLINQGWDDDKITAFNTSQGVYPSNADVWSAGRDSDNNFSPAELVKIDFGTSPAPKGRLTLDPFNTYSVIAQDFPLGTPTSIVGVTFFPQPLPFLDRIQIDTGAVPHGLEPGDEILISGVVATCNGTPVSFDGVRTVVQNLGTFVFRIEVPQGTWCDTPTITSYGEYYSDFLGAEQGYTTLERPTVTSTFAGRVFYAGTQFSKLADKVFFSQIASEPAKVGICRSQADPTSEIDPDLVETDGGVITVNGLGTVLDMRVQQRALVLFTTNGIWEITGEGDSYFSATGYSVRKITSVPCISTKGVVDVEGSLMFLGEDGIYALRNNEVTYQIEAINITAANIKSYYMDFVASCNCNARAVYDYKERRVLFLYGQPLIQPTGEITTPGGGLEEKRLVLNNALVFNLDTQSFTKYAFPFGWGEPIDLDTETTVRIMDAVAIRNITSSVPCVRYIYRYREWGAGGNESRIGFLMQGRDKNEGMDDADVGEVLSYVYTGHATLGDVGAKKTARQLILHMQRTEEGFTIEGEEYTPIHPSSAKVRVAWDFTTDEASNKWQLEFQGYRYRQFYMPSGTGPTHVGYDVITTKTKLRGTGRAFSMRFRSEPGHDMNILGWSITGSVEGSE